MSHQSAGKNQIPADQQPDPSLASSSLRQASVVHDVNQMLAVILGRAEILLQREGTGSCREDLEAIVLAAGDAAAILKRLQRGLPPRHGQQDEAAVNLRDTVRAVSQLIRPQETGNWAEPADGLPERSWVLDNSVPEDLFTTVPGQVVREVLSNLVANALEVLPGGGCIIFTATTEGGRVVLSVRDSGPGLDNQTAQRIFEPGFTSSGDSFRGIGLAGSRQLLKCFDGLLDLGQGEGPGALFQVDLPRIKPTTPAAGMGQAPAPVKEIRRASFPVLVVDDEPAVRDMLGDVLEELDCQVTAVRDTEAALACFEPGAFGMALVDQTLPGRSGLELAGRLRELDRCLSVVLITGWGQDELLNSVDPGTVDITATKPLKWTRIIEILDQGESLHRQRRDAGSGT